MKIANDLPDFTDKNAFIIVASLGQAEFYKAADKTIAKLESFKVGKPEFSDTRTYFANPAKSPSGRSFKQVTSGDTQLVKRDTIQRFEKKFKESVKALGAKHSFDEVYIFAPEYFLGEVQKVMPAALRKKELMIFKGNFHKASYFDLLKKIGVRSHPRRKISPDRTTRTKEANKIIRKSLQAKKVIKLKKK